MHATVEVFQIVDHDLVPQVAALQVVDQVRVHDGELTRQIRFHVQVLVRGFDGLRYARDIGNGRRGRDGHHVRIAHTCRGHLGLQCVPVEGLVTIDVDILFAPLLNQNIQ